MKRTLKQVSYAMGNFANSIAYQVFGNRIQFYYVDILGLNAATAGLLPVSWFGALLCVAATDRQKSGWELLPSRLGKVSNLWPPGYWRIR